MTGVFGMGGLLLAGLLATAGLARAADEPVNADPLFAATLTDAKGKPAALAAYKGKPLVVNFWARWCGPCREEIPDLVALQKKHEKAGVVVLGIAVEDQVDAVREFAAAYEVNYPVLVAREQGIPLMRALGNGPAALPYTLVLDRQGKVIYRKLGRFKTDELQRAVDSVRR